MATDPPGGSCPVVWVLWNDGPVFAGDGSCLPQLSDRAGECIVNHSRELCVGSDRAWSESKNTA